MIIRAGWIVIIWVLVLRRRGQKTMEDLRMDVAPKSVRAVHPSLHGFVSLPFSAISRFITHHQGTASAGFSPRGYQLHNADWQNPRRATKRELCVSLAEPPRGRLRPADIFRLQSS